METGEILRRLIRRAGVTKAEVARRSGIPVRTLRAILRDDVDAKMWQVCRIAHALGLPCWRVVWAMEQDSADAVADIRADSRSQPSD